MVYKDGELMQELLRAFQSEAPDHVQTLNQALLQLERRPDAQQHAALLQEAFRAAHSLKGAARAVGLISIEGLAHGIEEVLRQARDHGLVLDPTTCDHLYHAFDVVQKLLNGQPVEIGPLVEQLSRIGSTVSPEPALDEGVNEEAPAPAAPAEPAAVETGETIRVAVSKLDLLMAQAAELLTARISAEQRLSDMRQVRQQLSQFPRLWRDIKTSCARFYRDSGDGQRVADVFRHFEDYLHDLTKAVNHLDGDLNRDVLRLGMVSGRLQSEMRRVRMVPFNTLEPLFQRAVRDAARLESKQVLLQIDGGEIELDKKVLEALKDALLHLLRNAVSHGIETPDVRAARHKPPTGSIHILIVQRGGEAHITVRDDGRGFDLENLRRSAEALNMHVDAEADASEIINLAFSSGVSTSTELTVLSGRGVGLDVVRRQIETLQGRIYIENLPGQGAVFQFVVPVSLAMTRVLLVAVGSLRYALPLASVERIVAAESTFSVEGQAMLALEEDSLPLVPLAGILNLPVNPDPEALAVIVGAGEHRIALLVDDVITEQELAVKPLGKPLVRVRHLAGAAVLGSGEPVVVLNPVDLAKSARGVSFPPITVAEKQQANGHHHTGRILVVDDSITTRMLEKNILEAAGFEVLTATDGVQALHQLKSHPIALVVADVEMPNMDGISLTRCLRDSRDYGELPVILVTSLESPEDRERGMVAGANAYIVKRGFNQAELLSTIRQLL